MPRRILLFGLTRRACQLPPRRVLLPLLFPALEVAGEVVFASFCSCGILWSLLLLVPWQDGAGLAIQPLSSLVVADVVKELSVVFTLQLMLLFRFRWVGVQRFSNLD